VRRLWFAALVVAFSLGAALLFFSFYGDAKDAAIAKLHEEQRIHARQAARGIEDFFSTWTRSLSALAGMKEIVEATDVGRREMRLFFEAHQEHLRSLSRVDERGVIVASYPSAASEGADISGQAHVREILRDHRPVVSDVFRSVQGSDGIALHVPVFQDGVFRGTIAVVVNFESIVKRYLEVIRVGESGHAWVVSRAGTLLYTPIPGFTGQPASRSLAAYPSMTALLGNMLRGREGAATYTSDWIRGRRASATRHYAVYAPIRIGNTWWSIVVASTERELLAGLNSFRNRLALVVGGVYLGGMLLAGVAAWGWLAAREENRRRLAEDAARSSERLRALMASAVSDVLFYLEVEGDGGYRFLSVNPAFLKATGLAEGDVVGRRVEEVIPEPARAVVLEKYAAAIAAGETLTWDETSVYPAGTKYGEVSVTPIFDAGGRCTNLFGIVHDVTERRVAQERLAAQAALLDQAKDAILVRDLDGTVRYWNKGAERLFGWTAAEAQGRRVTELFSRDPSALLASSGRIRLAGEWSGEEVFTTRTGRQVVVEVSCTLLRDERGEPRSILVINTDATERKRAEAELERHRQHLEELVAARTAELAQKTADLERSRADLHVLLEDVSRANRELEAANARLQEVDRLKSLFIATMSHELRTPLNSIIGFTGILLQGLAGALNPEQRKQLGMVKASSEHLLALITDIIDLSKIEAGKISLAAEDVDLVRLARDVVGSLEPAAARAGLALSVEAPEALRVVSDPGRVRQVLVNLVGNAVKFTERGGVTVVLERRDGWVRVAVRDTGPGIREEDMGRLFQFFSRVPAPGVPAREGTGLGLYLSRKIVTLLGGEIVAESEPGRGSVFAFTLPLPTSKESA